MILVTGATGHIGNALARTLTGRGQPVRALVLPGEDRRPLEGLPVEVFEGDVLEPEAMRQAVAGVDTIYHLAGMISIQPGHDPRVWRVNVDGTANVVAAAREAGVRRLVYTSSIHAIQRAALEVTVDEQLPFDPDHALSDYDRSKAQASLAVLQAARQGLGAVIVCPTGVIGPYDYRGSEMGRLLLDALQARVLFSVDGAYDFVDVRDVAQGQILACERGRPGECYILSGEQIRIPRILEIARESIGRRIPHLVVSLPLARILARIGPLLAALRRVPARFTPYAIETVASNSRISHAKASRELGYHPRSLPESIADSVAWLLENQTLLAQPVRLR
jgi:dihydroflavonol-4-reductase